MTDLSLPPLNLTIAWPTEGDASPPPAAAAADAPPPSDSVKTRHTGFRWPTPPFAGYPLAGEQTQAEACTIEGVNGKLANGRLMAFLPDDQVANVQVPPARTTLPLRFNQFRSLALTEPLKPQATLQGEAHADMLTHRPRSKYRIEMQDGAVLQGETIGHVDSLYGLFLFPPLDDAGTVSRLFVPRELIKASEVGERIGELLVQSQAVTADQVAKAAQVQQELRTQKVGDILVGKRIVSAPLLLAAIEEQSKMPMVRIGEALMALKLVTQKQLNDALEQQKVDRTVPLGELLIRLGSVSREDLQTALSRKMGYPLVDVAQFPIETDALKRLPYQVAQRLQALPLLLRDTTLVVALGDPSKRAIIDEIEFAAQCKVAPVLARYGDLDLKLNAAYKGIGAGAQGLGGDAIEFDADDAGKLLESLERDGVEQQRSDSEKAIEQSDNSLVRLINTMIIEAHTQGVSDIHIESYPGRDKIKIRFRKDGILRPYLELQHTYRNAVIGRIKIMCDLDISERRKPQDGKINFAKFSPSHKIELRVATIPTNNGLEDVVMRILASARPVPVDQLSMSPANLAKLKTAMERPYGMVLCVGPTGSGKTTTLHSALSHINVPERKIWTAEDPVEITQPGLRQVQVNPKIDWTFAKALRAFLRADPDVIMVGEVRDAETAKMAVEASLTGHLVLSTLHTNSAPETVTRLLDMGMDPFNFADSLLLVVAQRLVRKLCGECRTSRVMTELELAEILEDHLHVCPQDDERFSREAVLAEWMKRFARNGELVRYDAAGCPHCGHTGFRGRLGLHEVMVVSRELRRLIQTGARAEELLQTSLREGLHTLRQDGIEKVLQGLTSMEEVRATSNS